MSGHNTTWLLAPTPDVGRRQSLEHQLRVLRVIARIEFKLKYADSALGYVWSIAKPMALFTVLYIVFGRFFKLGAGFEHYPLYLLIGIVLWTFFLDATTLCVTSLVSRQALLRKLSFPRIVIPISVVMTSTITLGVNLIPITVFLVWSHLPPTREWLLLIPLFVELFVFTTGVGLILATLFVRFRDVSQLWELIGQLAFYASPIIIPVTFLPGWFQPIVFLNPFVQIMQDVRAIVIYTQPVITAADVLDGVGGRVLPVCIAFATLLVGLQLFKRQSPWFAERV